MKPNPLIILLLASLCYKLFATTQVRDVLIYKGDTLGLEANPLETILEVIEKDMPKGFESNRGYLFGLEKSYYSTACWRGYIAEWKIIDNQLYLTNIFCCRENRKADLNALWEHFIRKIYAKSKPFFENIFADGKLKADWVTGKMAASYGKMLYHIHDGYESTFEKEIEFEFENGRLIGTKMYDNSKTRQSEYSRNNAKLEEHIYKSINWNSIPKLDTEIRIAVRFSANEHGIIDSVEVRRGGNELLVSEAVREIKSIPEWDIFYKRGKFTRLPYVLFIEFSEEMREEWLGEKE